MTINIEADGFRFVDTADIREEKMEIKKSSSGRIEKILHRSPAAASYCVWLLCCVTIAQAFIIPMLLSSSYAAPGVKALVAAKMALILSAAIAANHVFVLLLNKAWEKKRTPESDLVKLAHAKDNLRNAGVDVQGLALPTEPTNAQTSEFAEALSGRAEEHWRTADIAEVRGLSA